jgi:hypothetical protein
MHNRHLSHTFSGFEFGLGLVLGSASLALATTLLVMASYGRPAGQVPWGINTETAITSFVISPGSIEGANVEPLATSWSIGHYHYTFADTCLYNGHAGLLQFPFKYPLTMQSAQPNPSTTIVAGTVRVVQRSWSTIKLMFR